MFNMFGMVLGGIDSFKTRKTGLSCTNVALAADSIVYADRARNRIIKFY